MVESPVCPFAIGNCRYTCSRSSCAWWNERTNHCAILDIALGQHSTAAAIGMLDHYGKDL